MYVYTHTACLFYVCCSDCKVVCGKVCCVATVVKDSVFKIFGVLKYVVCLCKGCDVCCVFCLYCDAWTCMCSCIGMFRHADVVCLCLVSCVIVLNAAFCMTCSLLMLVEDARGDHMEGGTYGRSLLDGGPYYKH